MIVTEFQRNEIELMLACVESGNFVQWANGWRTTEVKGWAVYDGLYGSKCPGDAVIVSNGSLLYDFRNGYSMRHHLGYEGDMFENLLHSAVSIIKNKYKSCQRMVSAAMSAFERHNAGKHRSTYHRVNSSSPVALVMNNKRQEPMSFIMFSPDEIYTVSPKGKVGVLKNESASHTVYKSITAYISVAGVLGTNCFHLELTELLKHNAYNTDIPCLLSCESDGHPFVHLHSYEDYAVTHIISGPSRATVISTNELMTHVHAGNIDDLASFSSGGDMIEPQKVALTLVGNLDRIADGEGISCITRIKEEDYRSYDDEFGEIPF